METGSLVSTPASHAPVMQPTRSPASHPAACGHDDLPISVLDGAPDLAVFTTDRAGLITAWFRGAEALHGLAADAVVGQPADLLLHGDDPRDPDLAGEFARAAALGGAAYEHWHRRPDGTRFWASGTLAPVRQGGELAGFLAILRDRTAERAERERQALLLGEMNHRVKNAFALASAVARQTSQSATTPTEFQAGFDARLQAMARGNEVLQRTDWAETPLTEVLDGALAAFGLGSGRITAEGPATRVPAGLVLMLGLALHELATNAVKHGALSKPDGLVRLTWTLDAGRMALVWREQDGPAVMPPARRGFGSRLLEAGLAPHARVDLAFHADGLECRIVAPVPQAH